MKRTVWLRLTLVSSLNHYKNLPKNQGLYYAVDFASSGSSQIGGNISTNAGGIKVIRYGMTRDQILGLTVVTGKGDILTLNGGMLKKCHRL